MKFIIANDDGVEAVGIKTIANALKKQGHDVTVVAPLSNRSGFSHSLSVRKEMAFFGEIDGYADGVRVFALDGTPADCVKFAISHFGKEAFDVVLSGINNGSNISYDTMYSGTVGAAMEGGNQGIMSVALSVGIADKATHFDTLANIFVDNILFELIGKNKEGIVWNINCPDLEKSLIKGIRYTRLGRIKYDERYTLVEKDGGKGYVLKGELEGVQTAELETDVGAFFNGYISITPLFVDRTAFSVLEELR